MKGKIKKIFKFLIRSRSVRDYCSFVLMQYNRYKRTHTRWNSYFYCFRLLLSSNVVLHRDDQEVAVAREIATLLNTCRLSFDTKSFFLYIIDPLSAVYSADIKQIGNMAIDYKQVLEKPSDYLNADDSTMSQAQKIIKEAISSYYQRIQKEVNKRHPVREHFFLDVLENLNKRRAVSFEEALQRILLYNQLLWQTGHRLNGLGRLDQILYPYYKNDIDRGKITKNTAEILIQEFLKKLHEFCWMKSNELVGDTGQIIILGGIGKSGIYQGNDLTDLYIRCSMKLRLPDPKLLLRVSDNMPNSILKLAVECISTGIGSPLLSNDDIVIPCLKKFGYQDEDCFHYITSACWEPFLPGKSFDQNNLTTLNYLEPLFMLFKSEVLDSIRNFSEILNLYDRYLKYYIESLLKELKTIKWCSDPLLSYFTADCSKKKKDITMGGAVYSHFGINTVAMANTVDSLLNIKEYVFNKERVTLQQFNDICRNNFLGEEEFRIELRSRQPSFGNDEKCVIELVNHICKITDGVIKGWRNRFGGKLKFGLSAPSYLMLAQTCPASFDGRKKGEAFHVHISSDKGIPYTELVQFSSQIRYDSHRFNGNVVDMIVAPSLIENNIDKFILFLKCSIKTGFYQMQFNVISSKTMENAKLYPYKYKNLIVRVWGFSAYFVELPEDYQNLLIERAKANESASI